MKRTVLLFLIIFLVSLFISFGMTAQMINKKTISLELAKKIAAASEAEAIKNKLTAVTTILDDGGNLVFLEKIDNTQIGSIDVSIGKARTALFFKRPSKAYEDQVVNGKTTILGVPNVLPIEGGLPLIAADQVIGAIGVGGSTPQMDGMVAKAGADVLISEIINIHSSTERQNARVEHIALNVPDPKSVAKWYVKNFGMIILREGVSPNYNYFIADSGKHMMIELFYSKDHPLFDLPKLNHMSFHLAFMVNNIKAIKEKLMKEKATLVEDISKTASGDQVLMLRDPWGLPIQFVERLKPLLEFEQVRPEHFALNVIDSRAKAKWYCENLGMKIVREGNAPNYGMFISDINENMMVELYQNTKFPLPEYNKINPTTFHIAFIVDDIGTIKEKLIAAGAKLADDITKTPAGDTVLMLRDLWGQPIQFVKRANPMLK